MHSPPALLLLNHSNVVFDLALMISLPSSELITAENAILQVTVKTEFLRLHLITRYTFHLVHIYICQDVTFIL